MPPGASAAGTVTVFVQPRPVLSRPRRCKDRRLESEQLSGVARPRPGPVWPTTPGQAGMEEGFCGALRAFKTEK